MAYSTADSGFSDGVTRCYVRKVHVACVSPWAVWGLSAAVLLCCSWNAVATSSADLNLTGNMDIAVASAGKPVPQTQVFREAVVRCGILSVVCFCFLG